MVTWTRPMIRETQWKRFVKVPKLTAPQALKNLAAMPLTVLGLTSIDIGCFVGNVIAGFIVTGLSFLYLEFTAADE